MSRHKLVKNLNFDEELEDFDGGDDYENEIENGRQESKTLPRSWTNTSF